MNTTPQKRLAVNWKGCAAAGLLAVLILGLGAGIVVSSLLGLAPWTARPEATATPKPTSEPTPTVWPPVFDFWSLEDIRSLDSFVATVSEKNTVNGLLTERTFTVGYIREPFSAYQWLEYYSGMDRTYVVNDRTYALTGSGDW